MGNYGFWGFSLPSIKKIWIKTPMGAVPCRPVTSPHHLSVLVVSYPLQVRRMCKLHAIWGRDLRSWHSIVYFVCVFVCLSHMTSGGASVCEEVKFGRHTFLGHICRQKQTQPEAKCLECQAQSIGKRKAWGVGTHSRLGGKEDRFRLPGSFPIAKDIPP